MLNEAVVRRTERWFVRQGMPQLIADYRFRSHVLPRMLSFLASTIVVSLTLAALLARIGPRAGVVVAATVLVVGLGTLPWLLNRLTRRVSRRSHPSATVVLIAYVVTPVLIPFLLIGAYGRPDHALVIGRPGSSTVSVAFATFLVLAAAFAAIFLVAWVATAYGVVAIAARAISHAIADMRGSLQLQGRAMPTLLFVTFFLFFTSELWQLMNHLSWGRLVLVLALFAAVTVLATSARLRNEVDRVEQDLSPERLANVRAATPLHALGSVTAAPPPALTPRQETNVLLVLVTRQLVQAAVVGLGLFAFFVVLGLIVVDRTVALAWIGAEPQHSAWIPLIPVALFRAAVLLAGFSSMYFAVTTMTQSEYRHEFFGPVIEDVERALAVRAVYLGLRSAGSTAEPSTVD